VTTVGVDVGGTFTDVARLAADGSLTVGKVLSQPQAIEAAVLAGLDAVEVTPAAVERLVHGTTITTNALLERRGAVVGMLTTAGFRDVLTIGRTERSVQYVPSFRAPPPLVPPELTCEIDERVVADGSVVRAPAEEAVANAADGLIRAGAEAIAICFLWSVANAANEHAARDVVERRHPHVPVFCSADVLAEFREYERFSTTAMTAFVAPRLSEYVARLHSRLRTGGFGGTLRIMQSNGGVMAPELAATRAASTLVSGPAGGVIAARLIGAAAGERNLITLDVGGTSTDVCLVVDGEVVTTRERRFDRHPVRVPMIDIHTVGAGGGSIARVDDTGALRVGPQSAGSFPGPACYGRGGRHPTVTDAYVVAGKLAERTLLGGELRIDVARAAQSLEQEVAGPLGVGLEAAANGVARVAEEHVNQAIRVVSVRKGFDPRDFTLVAFGGAGPLQAAAVAESLAISRILIPPHPGVTSALGLLAADVTHDFVRTRLAGLGDLEPSTVAAWFEPLEQAGLAALTQEGVAEEARLVVRSVELRYRGQAYELDVPLASDGDLVEADLDAAAARFHDLHERLRGISLRDQPVELVAVRVRAIGHTPKPPLGAGQPAAASAHAEPAGERDVLHDGRRRRTPVFMRTALGAGALVGGPAVIESLDSTIYVPDGWTSRGDENGNLVLTRG
jgi:N-methylhydantoinase A